MPEFSSEGCRFVEDALGGPEKRLIVMISIGSRPWAALTAELFRAYARTCGADFRLETDLPSKDELALPRLPDSPGRKHKAAYASKTYFAWRPLAREGYHRVLVVDDSCCVRSGTPDIFDLVPFGSCGGAGTRRNHAINSFTAIEKFLSERGDPPIGYEPEMYLNTGVMLYDCTMTDALAPQRIAEARQLLFAAFPHQTLSYYLLKSANIPIFVLPKSFNRIPAEHISFDERRHLTSILGHIDDKGFVYHLTGTFAQRDIILPELAWHMLRDFDPQLAAKTDYLALPRARRSRFDGRIKKMRRKLTRMLRFISSAGKS